MSLFFSRGQRDAAPTSTLPARSSTGGAPRVEADDDLRTSVGWAAIRLRAELISSLPVDVFRKVQGVQMPAPTPPIMRSPGSLTVGGPLARVDEWLYATQVDLDRYGNAFGLVAERDTLGRPTRIDLVPAAAVSVRTKKGVVSYLISGKEYDAVEVWHERQYVMAGLPVGLSPVAYAAWSLGTYKSAQEFAATWFSTGVLPSAIMQNQKRTLNDEEAAKAKARVNATLRAGEVLVVGNDWNFDMVTVPTAQKQFLETMGSTGSDLARFFNVPGDVIDVATSGSSITYANLTQRNLQLLIMHLGPAIQRRENALTQLTAQPQFVKLNSGALLRMDPAAAAAMNAIKVDKRALTPDEWRALDNLPPLTPEQVASFAVLAPAPTVSPATPTDPATPPAA